jgi:hypothetical protein
MFKHKQNGLTKVEFMIVAVGFVTLVAYGLPALMDLRSQSTSSVIDSIAVSLSSMNAENVAIRSAQPLQGVAIANCKDLEKLMPNGLAAGYSIKSVAIKPGKSVKCTLYGLSSTKAKFTGTGIK